jgi:hypothetical protein
MRRNVTELAMAVALGSLIALAGCSPKQEKPKDHPTQVQSGGPVQPGRQVPPNAPAPSAPIGHTGSGAQPAAVSADFPPTTAEAFAKEVAADEKAAFKKYDDKKLIIDGVVTEKRDDKDGANLMLSGSKSPKETLNIQVILALIDDYTAEQFKTIKVGDKVRVNGVYSTPSVQRAAGKPSYTTLYECKIIK